MSRSIFGREWANQTEIGQQFGMSAVALGRTLTGHGLRDPATRAATPEALSGGYARSVPLKDGTPFFLWNRSKVGEVLAQGGLQKVPEAELHANRVYAEMALLLTPPPDDDGADDSYHEAFSMWPMVLKDCVRQVPKGMSEQVSKEVVARLKKAGLLASDDC